MDDLFSDLNDLPVPPTPPARPAAPNLADGLRNAGLLSRQAVADRASVPVVEPEHFIVAEPAPDTESVAVSEPVFEQEDASAVLEEAPQLFTDAEANLAVEFTPEAEPEPEPEPEASLAPPMMISTPVEGVPEAGSRSATTRRWLWVGGGAVLAVGVIAWLVYGSSNKEAVPEFVPTPVAEPVADKPPAALVAVEPEAPAPAAVETPAAPIAPTTPAAQDKGVQAPNPVPEVANKSAPNPAAKKPQRTKPVVQPTPTPAPTWQDDALDKLDDLEKRL
ncbi:hypothetical protein [Stenotrophomonas maltophilia]|uniref:hypothetical protein n=1 Tax=Stenotrophomonas maltophilia TaxID=40324 RepID=UPI0021BF43F5|nr:hypothetical protein [Stenotrophomonas maltophilia]UXL28776.1 hypothetical protein N0O74_20480 [Stenotrophomonas maltophilia]